MSKKRKNLIQKSIELDERKTPSDTIFSSLGLLVGAAAGVLLTICLIVFLAASREYAIVFWYFLYYPTIILIIVGLFCTAGQMIRNHYLSTIIGLIINTALAITMITISLVQGIRYGQVFAFPFYFL